MDAKIKDPARLELQGGPFAGEAFLHITQGSIHVEFHQAANVDISADAEEDYCVISFEEESDHSLWLTLSIVQAEELIKKYLMQFRRHLTAAEHQEHVQELMQLIRDWTVY